MSEQMSVWQMVAIGVGSGIALLLLTAGVSELAVRLIWLWEDWK